MKPEGMTHIELIRLILFPDPRKWSKQGPIYKGREDPDNFPLIRAMIDHGFFTGDSSSPEPRITTLTWKANDLYMATGKEGVRVRLTFGIGNSLDISAIHDRAVALHAVHGDKWNRRSRRYD